MKLSDVDINAIRQSDLSQSELALQYGVSQGTISNVQNFRGAYTDHVEHELYETTEPQMTIEEVVEAYGAIDIEDVELNEGEPNLLKPSENILLDKLVADPEHILPYEGDNKDVGNSLADYGYVRIREDKKAHKLVLTDEGKTRHALEHYRREYGLAELMPLAMKPDPGIVKEVKSRGRRPSKVQGMFSPEFEQRVGDLLERLVDHITGESRP